MQRCFGKPSRYNAAEALPAQPPDSVPSGDFKASLGTILPDFSMKFPMHCSLQQDPCCIAQTLYMLALIVKLDMKAHSNLTGQSILTQPQLRWHRGLLQKILQHVTPARAVQQIFFHIMDLNQILMLQLTCSR